MLCMCVGINNQSNTFFAHHWQLVPMQPMKWNLDLQSLTMPCLLSASRVELICGDLCYNCVEPNNKKCPIFKTISLTQFSLFHAETLPWIHNGLQRALFRCTFLCTCFQTPNKSPLLSESILTTRTLKPLLKAIRKESHTN